MAAAVGGTNERSPGGGTTGDRSRSFLIRRPQPCSAGWRCPIVGMSGGLCRESRCGYLVQLGHQRPSDAGGTIAVEGTTKAEFHLRSPLVAGRYSFAFTISCIPELFPFCIRPVISDRIESNAPISARGQLTAQGNGVADGEHIVADSVRARTSGDPWSALASGRK